MKKIIDGKRYDTDRAESVAVKRSTYSKSDFNWYEETLYRTAKGNWFIHGEGGPLTSWAEQVDDSKTYGENIRRVTDQEALAWLAEVKPELADQHFADQIEDA